MIRTREYSFYFIVLMNNKTFTVLSAIFCSKV